VPSWSVKIFPYLESLILLPFLAAVIGVIVVTGVIDLLDPVTAPASLKDLLSLRQIGEKPSNVSARHTGRACNVLHWLTLVFDRLNSPVALRGTPNI
jgi:hypothetical protein